MFDFPGPRLFGLPPGADFPRLLVVGLLARMRGCPPETLARVELYVNTRRMQRRLTALFMEGPARLLPRIRLVTDLAGDPAFADLPAPVPPLRRRLELAQLVGALLKARPDLGPGTAVYDLADSLAALMDEMQGEGVPPEVLHGLDVSGLSEHWARSREFIALAEQVMAGDARDAEGRRREVVTRLAARWQEAPPDHPVLVAGSTGSRGATGLFMQAVARLPQGAVVLPGFDFDQPAAIWAGLDDALAAEDHPQYRFRALMRALDLPPEAVRRWSDAPAPCPARNRLVSLSLRPAPVTDQWRDEGQHLEDLRAATSDMTLIEAPSPRVEALAIALRLRKAAEEGRAAALITPDRTLARQVTAAMDRWGVEPDDSAGLPLPLAAPGRLLRHIAALFGQALTAEALLTLLKHPLVATGGARGDHLRWTRDLELFLRKGGPAFPDRAALDRWAAAHADGRAGWATWLADTLEPCATVGVRSLKDHLIHHIALAEALAAGAEGTPGALWDGPAGEQARATCGTLTAEAGHGGEMAPADYAGLFTAVLRREEVRNPVQAHPGVMIWGTLEARVQGAGLLILGGLNEGVWPETPPPDPWLNRQMRKEAGLLLPERRIGLAAHDFQQAVGAKEVVLTRAIRDSEAETVPSRWLNRLQNLLGGLHGQGGPERLADMRSRGARWVALAQALDVPDAPATPASRPSPCPPVAARPRTLPVTGVERLIRDPYAVYARYILNLRPLEPLARAADARLRGTLLHDVLEKFVREGTSSRDRLLEIAAGVLEQQTPWPAARRLWLARLARVADWFLDREAARKTEGAVLALERVGAVTVDGFTLTAKADRIDRLHDGRLAIYDYKTGTPPTLKAMDAFDKQLLLEACIAELGGFGDIPPASVAKVAYIGLGSSPKEVENPLADGLTGKTWVDFRKLVASYQSRAQGYTARNNLQKRNMATDYDGLSRHGEWDESDRAQAQEVGE
ncbi:double-strand break repair protein AddB [Rhodovulum imhoffii]|uniref:Double-strand break repair protein AddB n=1 Tax=Rhodovulum imhoffii TaxID=365340 RepID=A0A2T5BRT9_9RHOB|nr:double-strand break repair protein AddB [Rhodovulum imhoffii]MBK5934049.1 double-strand break repair protein AddB [Rhodovulum imhoffii]PTN01934.1 double-strand break repair protein AddB [Rhodovulum imhoffii]